MIEFRMPSLGADMEAGTLVQWLKTPGETVARGDIIAVVDTEKGAIEIEVFNDGVLDRTLVQPGQKTPVGTVLAMIRGADEAPAVPAGPAPASSPASPQRPRVSPAARRAAEQLHVSLDAVVGGGPGGAITVADVERAAASAGDVAGVRPQADQVRSVRLQADEGGNVRPQADQVERTRADAPSRPTGMRAAIGAAMARAKREIPHLYLSSTIDVTQPLAWLEAENLRRPVTERLLPVALFVKAVGRAVAEAPGVNGFWTEGGFVAGSGIHVGCAISLRGGGLVAPALHDVNLKSLNVVGAELMDLVKRARAGALRSSEMSDATVTLTNLGELGVESAYAIIYPPQVAIVAVGRVVERPWVVAGRVEPRWVVSVTVSADHRAVDGRLAGTFLSALERALQRPEP